MSARTNDHQEETYADPPPLEDTENKQALERVAKTALDMIWQGFSYGESPFYNGDGNPKPGLVE